MHMPVTAMNGLQVPGRQAGLTLVELMVALTLGLFLALGLAVMMGDSSRTFKIQDDYARMQESAVASLRYIGDSLRHAGFYGQSAATLTLEQPVAIGAISPACGNPLDTGVPLAGYPASTTATAANLALPCIRTKNFRGPGPILVARLGTGLPVRDEDGDGDLAEHMAANTLYAQTDVNFGLLFKGSDFAASIQPIAKRYPDNTLFPIFPYQMHVYYVRPCSRPASGDCEATDDGGTPVPTLVRQELDGLTMVERPLAEGVERINFAYGVDTGDDGIADRYVADPGDGSLGLAAADAWARVVAVRVTLLVRSPAPINGQDDSGKQYDLDGDGAPDFTCTAALGAEPRACQYKRALFSQLIQVRNVAFRRGG